MQSLSQGGEYGSGATYLSEVSHPNRRGFYSGVWYMTLIGGQLLAILVLLALQRLFLTPEELKAWGWRIPFRNRRASLDRRLLCPPRHARNGSFPCG